MGWCGIVLHVSGGLFGYWLCHFGLVVGICRLVGFRHVLWVTCCFVLCYGFWIWFGLALMATLRWILRVCYG